MTQTAVSQTISAATTNATSVKASPGTFYGVFASNINASACYLKIYNKASAPTVGTDVPVMTILVPGNTAGGGVFVRDIAIALSNGVAFAVTTGVAIADTGAVALNEVVINLLYV